MLLPPEMDAVSVGKCFVANKSEEKNISDNYCYERWKKKIVKYDTNEMSLGGKIKCAGKYSPQ